MNIQMVACVWGPASAGPAGWKPALLGWRDTDPAAMAAFVVELDDAGDLRVERVVAAHADILAGVEVRSALADDDRSARYELAGEALHAEHLRLRVATVAG